MATPALIGLLIKCETSIQIGQIITAKVTPNPAAANTIDWSVVDSSGNAIDSSIVAVTPASPPISATVKLLKALANSQTSFRLKLEEGDYVSYVTIHMLESILSAKLTLDNGTTLVNKVKPSKCVLKVVTTLSENSTSFTAKFTSSTAAVAGVDPVTGLVSGKSVGTTTITATLSDVAKTVVTLPITVIAGEVTGVAIEGITLNIGNVFLGEDTPITLTTTPLSANYSSQVYTSSDTNVIYVSSTGGFVRGVSTGTAVITVRLKDMYGTGFIASVTKIVTVATDKITVSPSLVRNVNIGDVNIYDIASIVTILPVNATLAYSDLLWTSSKAGVATVVSDGTNLTVTALSNGTTVITAKSPAEKTITASMTFIVETALGTLTTDIPTSMFVDDTKVAKVTARNGTKGSTYTSLVWTSDDPSVVSVAANGKLTALAAGSCNITATITGPAGSSPSTLSSTTAVAVTRALKLIQVTPNVASLNISSATPEAPVTLTLTASLLPADAGNQTVVWTSLAPLIASVPASSTGSSVVVTGLKPGTADIKATSQENSKVFTIVTITVGKTITGVTFSYSKPLLTPGLPLTMTSADSIKLKASVTPPDAIIETIVWSPGTAGYLTDMGVIMPPSEADMASNNGTFSIPSNGQWSVTVSNSFTPSPVSVTADADVTVTSLVRSLELDPIEPLEQGNTYSVAFVLAPSHAVNQVLTWTSSDVTVATVDSTGLVTAVAALGTARITAKTTDGSKITASTIITVGTPPGNNYNVAVDFTGSGYNLPTEAPAQMLLDPSNPDYNLIIPDASNNVIYKVNYGSAAISILTGTYQTPTMVPIAVCMWSETWYYYYDNLDGSVHVISQDGGTGYNLLPGSETPTGMVNLPIIAEWFNSVLFIVRKGTNPDPIKYDPVSGEYVTNHLANYAIYLVDVPSRFAYAQWLAGGSSGPPPPIYTPTIVAGDTTSTSTVAQDTVAGVNRALLKPFKYMTTDTGSLFFIDASSVSPRMRRVNPWNSETYTWDIKGDIPRSGFNSLSYSQHWNVQYYATGDSSVYWLKYPSETNVSNYLTSVKIAGGNYTTAGTSIYYANFVKPLSAIASNDGNMYVLDGGANQIIRLSQNVIEYDVPVLSLDPTKTGNGNISITWTPTANAVAYHVYMYNSSGNNAYSKAFDISNLSCTATGLLAGNYNVYVNSVFITSYEVGSLVLSVTLDSGYSVPMVATLDTNAVYSSIGDMVLDASGVMYATDYANHYVYKIVKATDGSYTRTNLAGTGATESRTSDAGFNQPLGIAYNPNTPLTPLYLCDSQNKRIVSLSPTGTIATVFDGQDLFDSAPINIVCDVARNVLYVSDPKLIYEIPVSDTGVSKIFAGNVSSSVLAGGVGTTAVLSDMQGLAIDSVNGLLYTVATPPLDSLPRMISIQLPLANMAPAEPIGTVTIYNINPLSDGNPTVLTGAQLTCVTLKTSQTTSMQVIAAANPNMSAVVYYIKNVNKFDQVRISGNGLAQNDGPLSSFSFGTPTTIAADASGNLYVCESTTNTLRAIRSSVVPTPVNKEYCGLIIQGSAYLNELYYTGGYGGMVYMITIVKDNTDNTVVYKYKYIDAFTFLANSTNNYYSWIDVEISNDATNHRYDITSINSLGASDNAFSTVINSAGSAGAPFDVVSVAQIGSTYTSVTVQWVNPNPAYGVSSYVYTVSDTSNIILITNDTFNNLGLVKNAGQIVDHGVENNSVTFTGLTINTTYNISITPVNTYGPSRSGQTLSGDFQASTLATPIIGAPELTYDNLADTSVTITAAYTGGSTVETMNIYRRRNSITQSTLNIPFTTTPTPLTDLVPGSEYLLYARVVNAYGHESLPSNDLIFTTTGNPPPGAPTITAPATGDVLGTLVVVSWTSSPDSVNGYIVYYSLTGYDTVSNPSPLLTSTNYYIYDLPLSSDVYVSVVAMNAGTPSAPSQWMYTTTDGTPYTTPDPVSPVAVVQVGTAVGIQWGETTTPLTGFALDYQLVGSTYPYTRVYLPPTQNLYLFNYPPEAPLHSLENGTYNVIIRAKNDTVFSSAVSVGMIVQLSTAPDAPIFNEIPPENIGDNFITLYWRVPAQPTSSFPSYGYKIYYNTVAYDTTTNEVLVVDGTAPGFKLSGLLASTTYYISIVSSGVGGDSAAAHVTVKTIAPTIKMNPSVATGSDGKLRISVDWAASTSLSPGVVFAMANMSGSGPGAPEGTSNANQGTYVFKRYVQLGETYTLYAIGGSASLGTVQSSITYTAAISSSGAPSKPLIGYNGYINSLWQFEIVETAYPGGLSDPDVTYLIEALIPSTIFGSPPSRITLSNNTSGQRYYTISSFSSPSTIIDVYGIDQGLALGVTVSNTHGTATTLSAIVDDKTAPYTPSTLDTAWPTGDPIF